MRSADFDYELPLSSIAQKAHEPRDQCKLAVVDRASAQVTHSRFDQIGSFLRPGDLLVVNDSKVLPARIPAKRASGGSVELFLLDPAAEGTRHSAFLKPAHRVKDGELLTPERDPELGAFRLLGRNGEGVFQLQWESDSAFNPGLLERIGVTPLPPYILRERLPAQDQAHLDQSTYQTVYAREAGSVAAPTAGLHFSEALLAQLQAQGIGLARVTLHVGAGTFLPVKTESLEEHPMHEEAYCVPRSTQDQIQATRAAGGRIVAVGTTALRALESAARQPGFQPGAWYSTRLFLKPGDAFLSVTALLTNFHQPHSTLLPLVCAFWNKAATLAFYRDCLSKNYQFLSYGDACLFL